MNIIKKLVFLLSVVLLLLTGCKKGEVMYRLPEVEPMGFEIPDEIKGFYERLHRKGDSEFTFEEFFGENVRIPRPPFEKERRLKDKKKLIEVKRYLGKFEEAESLVTEYLSKEKNSVDAINLAGHYYLERNKIIKALNYLLERSKKEDKPANWLQLIEIAKEHNLHQKKYEYLDHLIASFPDSHTFYKEKMVELKRDKKKDEWMEALKSFYQKFPDEKRYYLKESQMFLSSLNREKKAIELYLKELDPLKDIYATSDFFAFLGSLNRLREYKKEWKSKRDKKSILFLFLVCLEKGDWEEAEMVITKFIRKYPDDSYLVGKLYRRLGYPRYSYDYFLKTLSNKGETEGLLFEIFKLLTDETTGSVCYNTRPTTDVIFTFDKNPGIGGGLLSLYYNTLDYDKREESFEYVKGKIMNLSFTYELFSYVLKRYPDIKKVDSLYSLMMKQLLRHHINEPVIELGNEYIKKFKKGNYVPIYEAMAAGYIVLGKKEKGNNTYRKLLNRLSNENRMDEYHAVFERFVSKLISQKDYTQCTRLYWGEIKKHPKDERLYQRFLSLIYNYNLYHEELKVYKYAVRHFDEKTWYHKLARWYIRHKGEEAFRNQTQKIKEIFNDKELEAYLREFVHFDPRKGFSDPGNRFYLAMYKYGMSRFPDNVNFAKELIRYYSRAPSKYNRELLRLYKTYFFYDTEIRLQFLKNLSKKKTLMEYVKKTRKKQGILYTLFDAEAARYLSMNEKAEKPLQYLTLLYPDRLEFAERLANLYRSIDFSYYYEDRELTEKGIGVFLREIKLFPTLDTLYTQLGEMLVESNRYESAKTEWMRRIDLYPGSETSYLNVATILWDYYDFVDAVSIIKKARETLLNDTLFAKEMAVLCEELKDYKNAIKEYINASLAGKYFYYEIKEVTSRLIYLTKVHKLRKLIEETFIKTIQKSDTPDKVVRIYADYLDRLGLYERKLDMYGEILPLLQDPYTIREILFELEATDRTYLIFDYAKRLVDVTGGVGDYLLLASTYENQKKLSKAKSIYKELLRMLKDEPREKMNIFEVYSEFLWRHNERSGALDLLFEAQSLAKGARKASILHNLAYRAISINDFRRAKRAFALLLNEDPYNVNYFNLVGDMYQKLGDAKGLENVYLEKIKLIGKSSLSYSRRRHITKELYLGLARRLKEMNMETRAQDYYIESINRDPENISLLDEVYTFSKKNDTVNRLTDYYKKTAQKSYKDYRWQMVLVRFYLREGDIDVAIEELKKAVGNQPQKAYLHEELADRLTIQGKYDEAIKEYEKAYILSKTKNEITRKIALIYLRRGEKEKMFLKFDELIKSKPKGARKYFDVARICLNYGLTEEAFRHARKGKRTLEQHPYSGYLDDTMLSTLSKAYLCKGRAPELFGFLFSQYAKYYNDSKKEKSYMRNEAITRSSRIRYFLSTRIVSIWNDFSDESDRRYLCETYNDFIRFPYNSNIIRALLQFAKNAEMPRLAERLLHWKLKQEKKIKKYPSLYEVSSFYEARGAFKKSYDFLKKESNGYARLAKLSRIVSKDEELIWLRKYYKLGWKNFKKYHTTFSAFSPLIERYLNILSSNNMSSEIEDLTHTSSSYNGQILNYFYQRKNGTLAFDIIDLGFPNKREIWKKAKKAFVSFNLDYKREEGKKYFMDILDIRGIGDKIEERRIDVLTGRDYYINSFFYGEEDSCYLFSRIEASPRNSRNYRYLGNYYYRKEKYKSALEYLTKAILLAPSNETYIDLARTYVALGDKKNALKTLKNLDGDDFYSKAKYINSLISLGFQKEGENVLTDYLQHKIDFLSYGETKRAINLSFQTLKNSEGFLKELSQNVRKNDNFYNILLKNKVLNERAFFIKRYLGLIERGRIGKNFYQRRTFIVSLIDDKRSNDALELVIDTEKGVSQDSLPIWFVPQKAELLFKLKRNKEAVILLRDYIESREYVSNWAEILKVLDSAGKNGLTLRRDIYEGLITRGRNWLTNYLGLAETYLLMGKDNEAVQTLNELALKMNYAHQELFEIAKLLYKFDRFEHSSEFLERVLRDNPDSQEAKLLKARLLLEMGQVQDGCKIAINIITNRNKREFKEEAFEIVENCGERGLSIIDKGMKNDPTEDIYIAKARLLKRLNKKENAISLLRTYMNQTSYYTSRVPLLLSKLTKGNESISYLYKALYIKGDTKDIVVPLVMELMKEERDEELQELIVSTPLNPSRYLDWYDEQESKKQYISRVRNLLSDKEEKRDTVNVDSILFNLLLKTAQFYERIEEYESTRFILESILTLEKDEKIVEKLEGVKEKMEEMKKVERFIIKEDLSNGETL